MSSTIFDNVSKGEVYLAKELANVSKTKRDKALSVLKRWIRVRASSEWTRIELLKLWRGLFYALWHADGVQVQQKLAMDLAKLQIEFGDDALSSMYVQCGLETLLNEWTMLDKYRLDKFLSLVRYFVRQIFAKMMRDGWSLSSVRCGVGALGRSVLDAVLARKSLGLLFHVADLFWDELERVVGASLEVLPAAVVGALLRPWLAYVADAPPSKPVRSHLVEHVFHGLGQRLSPVEGEAAGSDDDGSGSASLNVSELVAQKDIRRCAHFVSVAALVFEYASARPSREDARPLLYKLQETYELSATDLASFNPDYVTFASSLLATEEKAEQSKAGDKKQTKKQKTKPSPSSAKQTKSKKSKHEASSSSEDDEFDPRAHEHEAMADDDKIVDAASESDLSSDSELSSEDETSDRARRLQARKRDMQQRRRAEREQRQKRVANDDNDGRRSRKKQRTPKKSPATPSSSSLLLLSESKRHVRFNLRKNEYMSPADLKRNPRSTPSLKAAPESPALSQQAKERHLKLLEEQRRHQGRRSRGNGRNGRGARRPRR
jgi:ribosomal RNA-processing protein 1